MGLKKIAGFFQIISSIAIVSISFLVYYEANVKNSVISSGLSVLLIASGILAAILLFFQGIANISHRKKLTESEEAGGTKKRPVVKELKKKEEEQKEEIPAEQEEFRRIGSSVKVLKG